ncbi:UPF0287-domain-containing protein [Saitoella complicata NRRL Y-17804]|uniref:UPF0287-domain-containing protein n=1 Tax=Saitoella complicata (strain BCRC 22490 / CBS 7301 / JCM 7358 / NBRC 10748 / NRRL Y-17804) TaxID=698492 RepID=UPI000867F659|nr:UPF0287-domain-containing protein [Saitoella complicata NRRL Y-17804]ODQ53092.1 UPF0287-domain-containing protein [Saitoella complicata NRRL Y-17804]
MHPPLTIHRHPGCEEIIHKLEACHKDWVKKFSGGCNDYKQELTLCLRAERLQNQKANQAQVADKKRRVKEKWAEIEENS